MKKVIAGIAVILLLIFGGIVIFYHLQAPEDTAALESELNGYLVPPVTIGNVSYTVQNGVVQQGGKDVDAATQAEVLRIAYASVMSRIDPVFGMEGTDPDRLIASVNDLTSTDHSIAALYDLADAAVLQQSLYPIDMLDSAAQTERDRQALITAPSLATAQQYYTSLGDTIAYDIAFSQGLETLLTNNSSIDHAGPLMFFGGYTSGAQYANAIQQYLSALQADKQQVALRSGCLQYFSSQCPSLSDALATLTAPQTADTQVSASSTPADVSGDRTIMEAFLSGQALGSSESGFFTVALPQSSCFPQMPVTYYLVWTHPGSNGTTVFDPAFISDIYFYDTKTFVDPRVTPTLSSQVPYLYQSAANPYMCLTSGDDLTRLMTVSTIRSTLANAPLFAGDASSSIASLEQTIVSSDVVNEADVVTYLNQLRDMLQSEGEAGLASTIGASKVFEIEDLLAISTERSANFDEIVEDAVTHENAVSVYAAKGAPISLSFMLLARSYSPFLLLTYNGSVSSSSLAITTPFSTTISNFQLVSYNDTVSKLYSPQQTLNMMRLGAKLENQ